LLLAERVTNPDDLALPASYDLIRVDVAQRAVVERFTLPDVDLVSSIHPGGGSRRAYVLARDTAGDYAYFLVDLAARSVVRVTGPGPMPVSAEDSLPSPDGRFLVYHWNITNDLRGFDAQAPGPERVLWSAPAAPGSFVTDKQWIEGGGATLLVRVQNFFNYTATSDTSLWVVPLGAPSQAREVVSYVASNADLQPLVNGDVAVYAAATNGGLSEIRAVRLSTGQSLGVVSPAGGVALLSLERFTGDVILLTHGSGFLEARAGMIRLATPGVLEAIAPETAVRPYTLAIDEAQTAVTFISETPNQPARPLAADLNLLQVPVELQAGRDVGEEAYLVMPLGTPDR
jgi:hypothetical protein